MRTSLLTGRRRRRVSRRGVSHRGRRVSRRRSPRRRRLVGGATQEKLNVGTLVKIVTRGSDGDPRCSVETINAVGDQYPGPISPENILKLKDKIARVVKDQDDYGYIKIELMGSKDPLEQTKVNQLGEKKGFLLLAHRESIELASEEETSLSINIDSDEGVSEGVSDHQKVVDKVIKLVLKIQEVANENPSMKRDISLLVARAAEDIYPRQSKPPARLE